MTIKVPKTIETEVTITPPLFWVKHSLTGAVQMLAYIDENTVVSIYDSPGCTIVKNTGSWLSEITKAYNMWQHTTEDEFFQALETATQKLTLKPVGHETIAH